MKKISRDFVIQIFCIRRKSNIAPPWIYLELILNVDGHS